MDNSVIESWWDLARVLLMVCSALLIAKALWRVRYAPYPHQKLIMFSWVLLLVVVIGEQYARLHTTPSWRTFVIAVALGIGYAGERAWRRRDRLVAGRSS